MNTPKRTIKTRTRRQDKPKRARAKATKSKGNYMSGILDRAWKSMKRTTNRLLLDQQETIPHLAPRTKADNASVHTKGGEETQNNRTRWNSKGHIEQTQPENESRYPRTLQEENPQGITEVDTRENPQHERDDNSERRQVEPHKDLAHTQSKAPRAQESSNINELWKRTKAAQTKTKTKRKKAEDRRKGRTKQEATTAAKDNRDNEEDNEKWATKTEEPPTLENSLTKRE